MSNNNFSLTIAQDLFDNNNPFPVDFDIAWQWLGYSRKADAKSALLAAGFITDIDLRITPESDNHNTSSISPQEKAVLARKENIFLTIECFKSWAMMSFETCEFSESIDFIRFNQKVKTGILKH
jgi:hypothetical protein